MSASVSTLYQLDGGKTLQNLRMMEDLLGWSFQATDPHTWDGNPITKIVKDDALWDAYVERTGKITGTSFVRSQIICQQLYWQHGPAGKGPEGDGLPKTLRKLWYAGHKDALQHASKRLGVWRSGDKMNDNGANGAMIGTYGEFVDTKLVTYLDLFVKDGSRQFELIDSWQRLPEPLDNILICIEKDAAYEDCVRIAKALGARVALSGGGKMGKAGTERMLRECFSSWFEGEPGNRVTEESPLYILTISDWDYDGEAVIAPTFRKQIERYVDPDLIQDVRVGIKPAQITRMGHDVEDKAYMVKNHINRAYSSWCRNLGVYVYQGRVFTDLDSLFESVPDWQQDRWVDAMIAGLNARDEKAIRKEHGDVPFDYNVLAEYHTPLVALYEQIAPLGFELDALKRVEYADLIIEGLLEMVDWETFTEALSQKNWADPDAVIDALTHKILANNESYQDLSDHISDIEAQVNALLADLRGTATGFEERVREEMTPLVHKWEDDERITEDDEEPEQDDMAAHLKEVEAWNHWQPFSKEARNQRLQEIVEEEEAETIEALEAEVVEFEKVSLS